MTIVVTKPQEEQVVTMAQISAKSIGNGRSLFASNWLQSPFKKMACLVTIMVVIPYVALVMFQSPQLRPSEDENHVLTTPSLEPISKTNNETNIRTPGTLLMGSAGANNISYYHQSATSDSKKEDVVLLHGAAFTKNDWKTSGILELFQKDFPSITVTALDLPVRADNNDLKEILRALQTEGLIKLPLGALVTPSASGKSVTDWIRRQSSDGIGYYMKTWVPVAAGSVAQCTAQDLQTLLHQNVKVLAIYGDKDAGGKRTTQSLKDNAGAETLELPGGHPVYLDSPTAFVKAVGEKVLANS